MDARRLLTALPGEHRAGCCVRVVPQDAARDRLALDSFHHEARAQPVVRLEQEPDPRRGDAAFVRSGEQLELDRAVRQPDRGPGIAAKHEGMAGGGGDGVERPRFSRRAARQTAQILDRRRLPQMATDDGREQLLVDTGGHGAER